MISSPAASMLNGQRSIAAIHPDSTVAWAPQRAAGFVDWIRLEGSRSIATPALGARGRALDLIFVKPDSSLRLEIHDGTGWGGGSDLLSVVDFAPTSATISGTDENIYIVRHDTVYQKWGSPSNWTDWMRVDTGVRSALGSARTSAHHLCALRAEGRIGCKTYLSSWSRWAPVPGSVASVPSLAAIADTAHMVALGTDGAILHWKRSSTGAWSEPVAIGALPSGPSSTAGRRADRALSAAGHALLRGDRIRLPVNRVPMRLRMLDASGKVLAASSPIAETGSWLRMPGYREDAEIALWVVTERGEAFRITRVP